MDKQICSACNGTGYVESVFDKLARWNASRDEFDANNKYLYCPNCKKRCSSKYDSVDANEGLPTVKMHCGKCDHRWDQPRKPN